MFEVRIESSFSSAHRLIGYKGKCEALHGHNWKVEVLVERASLDKIGMVVDFHVVKRLLKSVLKKLDHAFLNELPYFSAVGGSASGGKKVNSIRNKSSADKLELSNGVNPTSENIAKYIFDQLRSKDKKLGLRKVTVWESDTSYASYIQP